MSEVVHTRPDRISHTCDDGTVCQLQGVYKPEAEEYRCTCALCGEVLYWNEHGEIHE